MSPRAATLVSFSSTVALYVVFWLAGEFGSPALSAVWNESLLKLALWAVPSILIVGFMWRMPPVEALRELGLATNPLPGLALGLLTLIPLVVLLDGGALVVRSASARSSGRRSLGRSPRKCCSGACFSASSCGAAAAA